MPGSRYEARPARRREQPEPAWYVVWHLPGGGWYTVIERGWEAGDAAHCRLCPLAACAAKKRGVDHCTVVVRGKVPRNLAPLFALRAGAPDLGVFRGGGDGPARGRAGAGEQVE